MSAILAIVFLSAGSDDPALKKEIQLLNSSWTVIGMEVKGKKLAPKERIEQVIFRSGKPADKGNDKKGESLLTYELDLSQKPKVIRAQFVSEGKKTLAGIYELNGDTLKLCLIPGDKAPKEFKTAADDKAIFLELKREKK